MKRNESGNYKGYSQNSSLLLSLYSIKNFTNILRITIPKNYVTSYALQFTYGPKQNRVRQIETKGNKLKTKGCMLIVSTQRDQQLCRLDN